MPNSGTFFFAGSIWLLNWHFFRVLWRALSLLLQGCFPKHFTVVLLTSSVVTHNFIFTLLSNYVWASYSKSSSKDLFGQLGGVVMNYLKKKKKKCERANKYFLQRQQVFYAFITGNDTNNWKCVVCCLLQCNVKNQL